MSRSTFELGEAGVDPLLRLRVGRAVLTDLLENNDIEGFDRGLDWYEREASAVKSPHDLYWAMALRGDTGDAAGRPRSR